MTIGIISDIHGNLAWGAGDELLFPAGEGVIDSQWHKKPH